MSENTGARVIPRSHQQTGRAASRAHHNWALVACLANSRRWKSSRLNCPRVTEVNMWASSVVTSAAIGATRHRASRNAIATREFPRRQFRIPSQAQGTAAAQAAAIAGIPASLGYEKKVRKAVPTASIQAPRYKLT